MIEITFKASSAVGANDGYFELWLDDVLMDTVANIDNDTRRIGYAEFGATGSLDTGTSGTIYFDEFESRRTSHIGPVPGFFLPTATPTATAIPTATPNSDTVSLDIPVVSSTDDAEEDTTGWVNKTSTDLELVEDSDNQQVGMRFTNVNIPQGATILNAHVQFTVDGTSSDVTSLIIEAEANDNPLTFGSSAIISTRPRTTASVSWEPVPWLTVDQSGPDQQTPDLASIIQETVNRTGWTSGNAIALIITGTGYRKAVSYNGDANSAPRLHIEYTLVAPTAEPTLTETSTPTPTPSLTPIPTQIGGLSPFGEKALFALFPLQLGDTPTPTPTPLDPTSTAVSATPSSTPFVDPTGTAVTVTPSLTLSPTSIPTQLPSGPLTISYDYDPLYRLTEANYSTGSYYHYTYDAVGNRLTETTDLTAKNYLYDDANRLTTANGITYTWDSNGNLLNDGVNTYIYDSANRLVEVSNQSSVSSYQYNGLGDRLSQTVDGIATDYTLDLNTGLTQVLYDGTNTYTYGLGRIAQTNTTTEYFLSDALGSVRQMTDQTGALTFAQTYDPYGVVTQSSGLSHTDYGFTGESYSPSTQLTYLRARYYNSADGRFLMKDPSRLESNLYTYTRGNPINRIDPSGLFSAETIQKNIHFFDFDDTSDASKGHSHWGFYVLLREISGENAATGATPIHVGYYQIAPTRAQPNSGIKWTSSEEVWMLNCDTIMVGHQRLSEYYKNVIKKQNEADIWWRDTSATYYSAFSEDTLPFEKTYVDGSDKTSFPHYAGFALAVGPLPFEFDFVYDIDGNEYLGIGISAGFSAGLSYMEGYSCDDCPNISSSEIKQAISGLCGGFQLNVIRGINIGLLCASVDPSYSSISLSGARTYYTGAQIGYGGGGSAFIPLPHGTLPGGSMSMSWRFAEYTQLHGLKFADAMKINGW